MTQAAAVILAGGAGTRLWPLSRSSTPKHLLRLVGESTLLRATYERARLVAERVLVVTEASQLEACRQQLPELAEDDWIAEPGRRGTAACLAVAAASLPPDDLMLSLHADHLIPDSAAFAATARAALWLVDRTGSLGTIGVRPTSPATGFGYIHVAPFEGPRGSGIAAAAPGEEAAPEVVLAAGGTPAPPTTRDQPGSRPRAWRALRFVEKPALQAAMDMVSSGEHLWNTGIFAWRNSTFLAELHRHAPAIHAAATGAAAARRAGDEGTWAARYLASPEKAVDHAVMERTDDLVVVEATFAWSDVGSWADLAAVLPGDGDGNVTLGDAPAVVLDGAGNLVRTHDRLVALLGVDDLVVVDAGAAILVMPRRRAQDVRDVVGRLRRQGHDDLL